MELYNINTMPLSNDEKVKKSQEKALNNIPLSTFDILVLGRDRVIRNIGNYNLRDDCAYRAVSSEVYEIYKENGFIFGLGIDDEYLEYEEDGQRYNNNKGVDWYLGGAAPRYGNIIIECPAYKEYFIPAFDNGSSMALDPTVRLMKSSGFKNPVPFSLITKCFDMKTEELLEDFSSKKTK